MIRTSGLRQEAAELRTNCIIWKDNSMAFAVEGFNSDEFKPGGLHETRAGATWNLGTISAFIWRQENQEILCRNGRMQDLPDSDKKEKKGITLA
jgi:hypothetical protein